MFFYFFFSSSFLTLTNFINLRAMLSTSHISSVFSLTVSFFQYIEVMRENVRYMLLSLSLFHCFFFQILSYFFFHKYLPLPLTRLSAFRHAWANAHCFTCMHVCLWITFENRSACMLIGSINVILLVMFLEVFIYLIIFLASLSILHHSISFFTVSYKFQSNW